MSSLLRNIKSIFIKDKVKQLNNALKKIYNEFAAELVKTVIFDWKNIYVASYFSSNRIHVYLLFSSNEQERIFDPFELPLEPDLREKLIKNMICVKSVCTKVHALFESTNKTRLEAFFFTLNRENEFRSVFKTAKDLPNLSESMIKVAYKYEMGIPIDAGGQEWLLVSEYIKHTESQNNKIEKINEV